MTHSGHVSDEFRGRRAGGLSNARSNADGLFPATLVRSLVMTGGRPGRQGHRGAPGPRVKPADERNRNEPWEWYDWFPDRTSLGLLPPVRDDPGRRRSPRSRGPCLRDHTDQPPGSTINSPTIDGWWIPQRNLNTPALSAVNVTVVSWPRLTVKLIS